MNKENELFQALERLLKECPKENYCDQETGLFWETNKYNNAKMLASKALENYKHRNQ